MACALKTGFSVFVSNDSTKGSPRLLCSSVVNSLQFTDSRSKDSIKNLGKWGVKSATSFSVKAQGSICVSRGLRWWEKTLKPNMIEIHSAPQLVDSLLNAGDRLVIVDFYSPGCGGCKALHPKICQFAESNPDAIFLKVNYEELRTMCHTLHIHVLPFFRFYRGAEGRLCSFSCTNATIKKFKDALGKYGTDRCSLGAARGLEESEILALASIGEVSRNVLLGYNRKDLMLNGLDLDFSNSLVKDDSKIGFSEGSAVVMA